MANVPPAVMFSVAQTETQKHSTEHIKLGLEEDKVQYNIYEKIPRNTTQLQSTSQQTTYTTVDKTAFTIVLLTVA